MNELEKAQILEQAQKVFFEAMLAGYAGTGVNAKKVVSEGGLKKTITFVSGAFKVIDEYWTTTHSDSSAGTTTILHQNRPIWWMSYGGNYPQKAIPTLKNALRMAYEEKAFLGCRGFDFKDISYRYENRFKGSFERFEGEEAIYETTCHTLVGSHKYSGMSLL